MAAALNRLAGDAELCRGMAEAGRDHVIQTFDLKQVCGQYAGMFREVAGGVAP